MAKNNDTPDSKPKRRKLYISESWSRYIRAWIKDSKKNKPEAP